MKELVAALKEAYCLAQGRELLAEQIIEEHFNAAAMGFTVERVSASSDFVTPTEVEIPQNDENTGVSSTN